MELTRFIEALRAAGLSPIWSDLGDALWLAQVLAPENARATSPESLAPRKTTVEAAPILDEVAQALQSRTSEDRGRASDASSDEVPEFVPHDSRADQATLTSTAIDVRQTGALEQKPEALHSAHSVNLTRQRSLLTNRVEIAQGLRHLKRKAPRRGSFVLDEIATIEAISETHLWNPIVKPELERWLDLHLIVDTSSSMAIWQPSVDELVDLFRSVAAFRSIRRWRLIVESSGGRLVLHAGTRGSTSHDPRELIDPTGRSVVILISDAVGEAWDFGHLDQLLSAWAAAGPTAIWQPLPVRLWHRTGVEANQVVVTAARPGQATTELRTSSLATHVSSDRVGRTQVPVLNDDNDQLSAWARLIASGGTAVLPVRALKTSDFRSRRTGPTAERSAAELIRLFRTNSSATAMRLAVYFSAIPLTLETMRFAQQIMLPESTTSHLTEVFLGGLLEETESSTRGTVGQYDFVLGVRDALLDAAAKTDALEVLTRVADAGALPLTNAGGFNAVLDDPLSTGAAVLRAADPPFARVARAVLARLGGPHGQLARMIDDEVVQQQHQQLPDGMLGHSDIELIPYARHVEVCGQRAKDPSRNPAWTCGSGHLLGGRLVLTAASLVCEDDGPLTSVLVSAQDGIFEASVEWSSSVSDIALLIIREPEWRAPQWRHQVRFGQITNPASGHIGGAVGFPDLVHVPGRRESYTTVGSIHSASLVSGPVDQHPSLAFKVRNWPTIAQGRPFFGLGMVGAAVTCYDARGDSMLVGVINSSFNVVSDEAVFGVTPISIGTAGPSFTEIVGEHLGNRVSVEPVRFSEFGRASDFALSLTGLLRASAAATPFRARPELAHLQSWCYGPEKTSIKLLYGEAGRGKTRLAEHLASQLAREGWATARLDASTLEDHVENFDHGFRSIFVVIDNADRAINQIEAVLAAAERSAGTVRLLLLARTAGSWCSLAARVSPQLSGLIDNRHLLELSAIMQSEEERHDFWADCVKVFASHLSLLPGFESYNWSELAGRLTHSQLASTDSLSPLLSVQVDSLISLLETSNGGRADSAAPSDERNLRILLAYERDYLERSAAEHLAGVAESVWGDLLSAATIWGAPTYTDATTLLSVCVPRESRGSVDIVSEWLTSIYPQDGRYWGGMQPEELTEHQIGLAIGRGELQVPDPATVDALTSSQLVHGLTLLGNAHTRYPQLGQFISDVILASGRNGGLAALLVATRLANPKPLLDALSNLIAVADTTTLDALVQASPGCPETRPVELLAARTRVDRLRESVGGESESQRAELASSLKDYSNLLAAIGQLSQSVWCAREAVDLYRAMAQADPGRHLGDLANALQFMSIGLATQGNTDAAIATIEESIELYRELDASEPESYVSDLAASLHRLAGHLLDTGRDLMAGSVAEEAISRYRVLASQDRTAYLPSLAAAQGLLARASKSTRVDASMEAVKSYRELAELDRQKHLPELAFFVQLLSDSLAHVGDASQSNTVSFEAVTLYRELAASGHHLRDLADSLRKLVNRLVRIEHHSAAAAAAQEEVDVRTKLNARGESASSLELAASLRNLSDCLAMCSGRSTEALTAAIESTRFYRELTAGDRASNLPGLAASVLALANRFFGARVLGDACSAARESVALYRELQGTNLQAGSSGLATALQNLALFLNDTKDRSGAMTAAKEALSIFEALASQDPNSFGPLVISTRQLVSELG